MSHRLVILLGLVASGAGCFSETGGGGSSGEATTAASSTATSTATATSADGSGNGVDSGDGPAASGTDGTSATEATGDDSTASTGDTGPGPSGCGAAGTCVMDPLPPGWVGPVAVGTGPLGDPAPCPMGWDPVATEAVFSGLDGSGMSCGCTCDPVGAADCQWELTRYDGGACMDNALGTQIIGQADCYVLPAGTISVDVVDVSTATCANGTVDTVQPMPTWMTQARICAPPPSGDACAAGECWLNPPPAFGRLCVTHPGLEECIGLSPFNDRVVVHADYDDQRSCPNACPCEALSASCGGTARIFDSSDCDSAWMTTTVPGCVGLGDAVDVTNPTPTATCGAANDEVMPLGTLEPTGTQTYCCLAGA